jgi:hypothetical protein
LEAEEIIYQIKLNRTEGYLNFKKIWESLYKEKYSSDIDIYNHKENNKVYLIIDHSKKLCIFDGDKFWCNLYDGCNDYDCEYYGFIKRKNKFFINKLLKLDNYEVENEERYELFNINNIYSNIWEKHK